MNQNLKTVLLVEDNHGHANLFMRCFKEQLPSHHIVHVSNGEEALHYLYRRGSYADPKKSPRPHVIFLDLRMPKVGGLSVLAERITTPLLASGESLKSKRRMKSPYSRAEKRWTMLAERIVVGKSETSLPSSTK